MKIKYFKPIIKQTCFIVIESAMKLAAPYYICCIAPYRGLFEVMTNLR